MNAGEGNIDLGPELSQFKEFTRDFPSDLKGEAITNSELMRSVHNSFARAEAVSVDEMATGKPEDAFHFISYVPFENVIYELDGLAGGPIAIGPCTRETWLSLVRPIIEERIQRYQTQSAQEIRFNLMAVIRDRRAQCRLEIEQIDAQLAAKYLNTSFPALSIQYTVPRTSSSCSSRKTTLQTRSWPRRARWSATPYE